MKLALLSLCLASPAISACLISGTVVDADTGRPLANAKIYAEPGDKARPAIVHATNETGTFCFDQLTPGTYQIAADRATYLPLLYGAKMGRDDGGIPFAIEPGATLAPLILKMIHAASIGGLAMHADGEPLDGANIELSRKSWDYGWQPDYVANTRTDEQGRFQFEGLAPGNYYLSADREQPAADDSGRPILDETGKPIRVGEALTYYSGALTFDRATPIPLRPGQHVSNAVLTMSTAPLRRVSGRVDGVLVTPARPLELRVYGANGYTLVQAAADRTFSVDGLPAGKYRIVAQRDNLSEDVDLTRDDAAGVILQPPHAYNIEVGVHGDSSGRPFQLRLTSDRAPRPETRYQNLRKPCCVIEGVPAGVYRLSADKFHITALRIDGQPQTEFVIDLRNGLPGTIDVALQPNHASAELELDVPSTAPELRITAVLIDEALSKMEIGGARLAFDQKGVVQFLDLAPGKYRAFAIEGFDEDVWGNPELVAALASKSVELTLGETDRPRIKVPVISTDEWTAALRKIGM